MDDLILQASSGVVKVERFDADVRVEGVFVEENHTPPQSGSSETVHEEFRVRLSEKLPVG